MPRVSVEQAEINRERIEKVSARLFREMGIDKVSVVDLMKEAGLTHGGFYGHFKSKDDLVAIACERAFSLAKEKWDDFSKEHAVKKEALKAVFNWYLSQENRNTPGSACPAALLAGDVAREPSGKPVHQAYQAGLDDLLGGLTNLQETGGAKTKRRQAIAQFSTMVGALLLSRAVMGTELSDEILDVARKELLVRLKASEN